MRPPAIPGRFTVEAEGALVATAMRWLFGADGGAVGMVIVSPDLQGRGIGRRLMEAILFGLEHRRLLLDVFQAPDRTLTEAEVDRAVEAVTAGLAEQVGGRLRT